MTIKDLIRKLSNLKDIEDYTLVGIKDNTFEHAECAVVIFDDKKEVFLQIKVE